MTTQNNTVCSQNAYSNNHWHLIPVNSHSKLLISRFIALGNLCKIEHQMFRHFMKYLDISVIS